MNRDQRRLVVCTGTNTLIIMEFSAPVDSVFTKSLPKVEVGITRFTHMTLYQANHVPLDSSCTPISAGASVGSVCTRYGSARKKRILNFQSKTPSYSCLPERSTTLFKRRSFTGSKCQSVTPRRSFFQVFSKLIYQLCNDLESLAYATNSVLEDFLADGVRYLELRTIPRASPESNITQEAYLTTVLDTIQNFKSRTQEMSAFLILALDRGNTTAAQATQIIDLAITNKPRGVVGVDLCGNPTQGNVTLYRDAFARAKSHGLGVTLHFAETPASGNPAELAALLSFQPDRLGHVIHVPDEFKREITRRRLGLELCMSCNVHAKLIEGGFLDHHFGEWRYEECPIALCVSFLMTFGF